MFAMSQDGRGTRWAHAWERVQGLGISRVDVDHGPRCTRGGEDIDVSLGVSLGAREWVFTGTFGLDREGLTVADKSDRAFLVGAVDLDIGVLKAAEGFWVGVAVAIVFACTDRRKSGLHCA